MNRIFLSIAFVMIAAGLWAQPLVLHKQHSFAKRIPAGNFSGITQISQGLYAVVDDKQPDGFYLFQLDFRSKNGKLKKVTNKGFVASGLSNRDAEDIVYRPLSKTLFINGEADSEVLEYLTDGQPSGRRLQMPEIFKHIRTNQGIESLAYDAESDRIWLTTEHSLPADSSQNLIRLQSFDAATLFPLQQFAYRMEPPMAKKPGRAHVLGVSALTALPDGRLLVLERECYLPKRKIGAWVMCRLFLVDTHSTDSLTTFSQKMSDDTSCLKKHLLCQWRTRNLRLANYEGMCLGPLLPDGRQVVVMVSDSQNRYGSLLRDWFKTLVLPVSLQPVD